MNTDRPMYRWRRMTAAQREAALTHRQENRLPWHGPPHFAGESGLYLITAACYEHRPHLALPPTRLADFEMELLNEVLSQSRKIFAWVILPNHYHLLVDAPDVMALLCTLGQLHGRTSYRWNGEDESRGRHVWHRAAETGMKSERHFWASFNYVLHNAVRHGYVDRWQDWPYSNAARYLAEVGRDEAERCWREYPLLDYGKGWDPPEL